MATHPEIRKWLLDMKRDPNLEGHFLHRPLDKFHFFSWATVAGETDITHLASQARRLWAFQFHVGAKEPTPCRTVISVTCPERYRLVVSGRRVAHHQFELKVYGGNPFSQRPSYDIVEEDVTIQCQPRYEYQGRAELGTQTLTIQEALDLV